jgi:hypothetical protein
MRTKLFTLFAFIFAVFLLTGFASAQATLDLEIVSAQTTANHNSDVTITFSLTHNGVSTIDQTGLDWTGSTATVGTWKTLPTLTSLAVGDTQQFVAVLNVPQYASGIVNAVLDIESASGSTASVTVPAISITSTPALSLNKVSDLKITQNGSINISNTGNVDLTGIDLSASGSLPVTFSSDGITLVKGTSTVINVNLIDSSALKFGDNSVTVTASSGTTQDSLTFSIRKTFCKAGKQGSSFGLRIKDFNVNNEGEGKDDEWKLLDEITVEVEVENEGAIDIDDVTVELALFDSSGNNVVGDLDFESSDEEEEDIGNLNDDEKETVEFKFKVEPDLEDGTYKLAVKAYSKDLGEENLCIDESGDLSDTFFEDIKIEREDKAGKFIAFDNIELFPLEATCGDIVSLDFDVVNVGDEDQTQTKVNLRNNEIGLNIFKEIRSDLDQGDSRKVSFSFVIPEDLEEKFYNIDIFAEYDYKERRNVYEETSDDLKSVPLKVFGCTIPVDNTNTGSRNIARISATLESDAKAGGKLIVSAVITNIQSENANYVIDASGFSSWAELDSISDRVLSVSAGESEEVVFVFAVDEDVSGSKSFTIKVSDSGETESREVVVNFGSSGSGLTGFSIGSNGPMIWVLGIINVILIILIIVVAVRIASR